MIALCTLLIFCFSLAETAIMSLSISRLQHLSPQDDDDSAGEQQIGESIRRLVAEPTRVVATVQVGLTVFSLTSVAIAVSMLAPDLAHLLLRDGVHHNIRTAVVALVLIVCVLTLCVGEIVPRAIALRYSDRVTSLVLRPIYWAERLERPLVALVLGISNLLVKPFGMTASFRAPVITEDQLRIVLEASQKEGVIQEDEKEMLHNVISFGDTLVHKVMTPRVLIRGIEIGQSLDKLINLIVDHGHSRIPVYEQTIDSVIGIIHAKDLLPSLARGHRIKNLRSIMRAPFFVPEQMRTDELLDEMRRSNMQLAIVQDEYGGTAGLVTIEDLLEEIVGEIRDEYDVEQPHILRDEEAGAYLVDARADIDDVNSELGLALSTDDFDTIGGFVFGQFGKPPQTGDSIDIIDGPDHDIQVKFTITKADGRRLQQLRIETEPYVPESEDESAADEQAPAK
jgi:putative hemolysin